MNLAHEITEQFINFFGQKPTNIFFAPGRVNLIGEHTDYNGGFVFPCALDFGTYGAARKRNDRILRFASGNFDNQYEIDMDNLVFDTAHDWSNYLKGVVAEFLQLGKKINGFDFFIQGDIPNAAGLSSSASIELLTAFAINSLYDCQVPMKEMTLLSQRAENQFVGVNCGIMDQYTVGFGKSGFALLLDCQEVQHEYVPLNLGDNMLIIANTNKQRGLADSKYNERRGECEAALAIFQKVTDIKSLCDLTHDTFTKHKHLLKDPILTARTTHVVYENDRTKEAVKVLNSSDIKSFGKLMNESHISLKDQYEVTGPELDALAEAAWKVNGVLGSRMTGAGFGGCTVSVVAKNAVDDFIKSVGEEYVNKTGLTASFYTAQTGNGVRELPFPINGE